MPQTYSLLQMQRSVQGELMQRSVQGHRVMQGELMQRSVQGHRSMHGGIAAAISAGGIDAELSARSQGHA